LAIVTARKKDFSAAGENTIAAKGRTRRNGAKLL
jgi:hypothetical protein